MNGRGERYAQGHTPGCDWAVTAYDSADRATHHAENLRPLEAQLQAKDWADRPDVARVWARKVGQ